MRIRSSLWARVLTLTAIGAVGAVAASPAAADSGGIGPNPHPDSGPVSNARIVHGKAVAAAGAPARVERAITAANRIVKGKPYCYGGGHSRWESRCYDCSGSISYALGDRGARLIDAPMPSGSFMSWGRSGRGRWITVYANGGHMYAVIAGLRLDTSMTAGDGPGWSRQLRHQSGFRVRHPARL